MSTFSIPHNEPVRQYAPFSDEREFLKKQLEIFRATETDIPMFIGGKEVRSGKTFSIHPPHDLQHTLGQYHHSSVEHIYMAIEAAKKAHPAWSAMSAKKRIAIFERAADLAATTYRYKLNGATMLCQSKNAYQAEIDSACELIDFLRFNNYFLRQIEAIQPTSPKGTLNHVEYRPLEGFVYALTPFNFTAIAANLSAAPALMGNTVVWKPAESQIYSAWQIMMLFKEAGLPEGVINLIYPDGVEAGDIIFAHPDFAGMHFTGSTKTFNTLWHKISTNLKLFKSYPRIVGETGGKNFVLTDETADTAVVSTALIRGAFELQGQKCSAASRAYIPQSNWDCLKTKLIKDISTIKIGPPEDFGNFVNAVIDERAFNKIAQYIDEAKANPANEIICGGGYDKTHGYFIEPTIILTKDPLSVTMCEEIFGPVLTIYLYDDIEEVFKLIDTSTIYALTGAVISKNITFIKHVSERLRYAAGNFYINDKPTGAVVNQQPFGGGRGSGTNDKAGSLLNLLRWTSPRSIKETLSPPTDFDYPFMR